MTLAADQRTAVRARALELFRRARPDHPIYWTSDRTTRGDFDGRQCALEIFDVPGVEQLAFLRALRAERREAEAMLGEPLVVIFHTPQATRAHYTWVLGPRTHGATLQDPLRLRLVRGLPAGDFVVVIESPTRLGVAA